MKCPKCNGSGWDDENMILCPYCDNGEIEQTNEEWLRSCSTEELAEILFNIEKDARTYTGGRNFYSTDEDDKRYWREWLKEKHT